MLYSIYIYFVCTRLTEVTRRPLGLIFAMQGYLWQVRVLDEKSAECAECMQTTTTK